MLGTWIEPVIAQLIMTDLAKLSSGSGPADPFGDPAFIY